MREDIILTGRILKISYYTQNNKAVPFLRLLGKWLNDLGFNIGDKVIIYQERPDELIIKKINGVIHK